MGPQGIRYYDRYNATRGKGIKGTHKGIGWCCVVRRRLRVDGRCTTQRTRELQGHSTPQQPWHSMRISVLLGGHTPKERRAARYTTPPHFLAIFSRNRKRCSDRESMDKRRQCKGKSFWARKHGVAISNRTKCFECYGGKPCLHRHRRVFTQIVTYHRVHKLPDLLR